MCAAVRSLLAVRAARGGSIPEGDVCVNECERELDAAESGAGSHSDASCHGEAGGRITHSPVAQGRSA